MVVVSNSRDSAWKQKHAYKRLPKKGFLDGSCRLGAGAACRALRPGAGLRFGCVILGLWRSDPADEAAAAL